MHSREPSESYGRDLNKVSESPHVLVMCKLVVFKQTYTQIYVHVFNQCFPFTFNLQIWVHVDPCLILII